MNENITTEHYLAAGFTITERYATCLEQISRWNQEILKDLKDITRRLKDKK